MKRLIVALVVVCVLLGASGGVAWAADAVDAQAKPTPMPRPVAELVRALGVVVIGVAFGGIVLLIRTILPPLAKVTDASIQRMNTKRLVVSGLLPLIGGGLLGRGLELLDQKLLLDGFGWLVMLPLALLALAGLTAAIPHLGRAVLRSEGREPTPLAAGLAGGLVLGLAGISRAWEPLGVLVGILLASWCLGVGLGTLVRGRNGVGAP